MFQKILIANRGENAVRIERTCERMGIATVAIYDEADQSSRHVQICNEAYRVAPGANDKSYLNAEAIVDIAKKSKAEAIHPGVDLLAETPAFVRAVENAGLTFIGPKADTLEILANKAKARSLAVNSGIRIIKGTDGTITEVEQARNLAESIGYPLALKALYRGAGIGLRVIENGAQLEQAVRRDPSHIREGQTGFYLESYIEKPRHLEVQIIADKNGSCIALGERECSIQKDHRKLLEESPAPALTAMTRGDLKRQMICESAVAMAKEADFHGVGTVEFLVDAENRFYFLGFVPRLQLEHSVTELRTDLDLVELQIRIAAGEKLPVKALRAEPSGHAVEARIYARETSRDLRRRRGKIAELRWPAMTPGKLRIETCIAPESEITPSDNPLIAKIVTYGPTRNRAILALDRILAETVISPITTNISFLRSIIQNLSFQAGQFDTSFCDALAKS
ncbi:MAG: ATP-grasp domain-containing protein [Deltaproteobacteria bacterium]|nr:ATP-grasp domain-containing protein [Deltaproteobacteria bacterium]